MFGAMLTFLLHTSEVSIAIIFCHDPICVLLGSLLQTIARIYSSQEPLALQGCQLVIHLGVLLMPGCGCLLVHGIQTLGSFSDLYLVAC